jgi:hypothetical protein
VRRLSILNRERVSQFSTWSIVRCYFSNHQLSHKIVSLGRDRTTAQLHLPRRAAKWLAPCRLNYVNDSKTFNGV